jgi:hypothetical protein
MLPGLRSSLVQSVIRHFRRQRMQKLFKKFPLTSKSLVLDVGGLPKTWDLAPIRPKVVTLNLPTAYPADQIPPLLVFGDGCQLPFRDQTFDLVFSNSVIEHLGTVGRQQQFASEIQRVGKQFFVQTPNRWFPMEHHVWMPVIHWFPKNWQKPILNGWSLWQMIAQPDAAQKHFYLEHYLLDVRLLTAKELQRLFDNGSLIRERFFGWTKSLIASSKSTS